MAAPFDTPMPGLALPVPPEVVAILRLPISVTPMVDITKRLEAAYGPDLQIRLDVGIDGWLFIAKES